MAFQLSFCGGPEKGRTVDLTPGQTAVLGRGEDCDVQVADPRASRVHCRLEVADDAVVLVDAGSTWGTKLNGNPVKQQRLKPGDVFELGETQIRFVSGSEAKNTLPPGSAKPAKSGERQGDVARQTGRHDDRPLHGRHRDRQRPLGRRVSRRRHEDTTGPWRSRSCGPS